MRNQLVPHAEEGGGEMPSDIDSNLITGIDSVSYFTKLHKYIIYKSIKLYSVSYKYTPCNYARVSI